MPKLTRWLKASKEVPVFSHELSEKLSEMNVTFAGFSNTLVQNFHVNPKNKEKAVRLLEENGYKVEEIEQEPIITA